MKKHTPYQLILESLEERVFFDANPVAVIVEPTDGGGEDTTPDGAQMQAESEAVAAVKDETTNTPLEGGGEQPDDDAASPDQSDTLLGESQENVAEEVDASGGVVADKDGAADTDGLAQNTTTTETLEDSGGSDQGARDGDEGDQSAKDGEEIEAGNEKAVTDTALAIDPMIGEDFTFTVTLDNPATSSANTLYGPYIDLYFESSGDDGDDGIIFGSKDSTYTDGATTSSGDASYLGQKLNVTTFTYNGTDPILHPYAVDGSGDALKITTKADGTALKAGDSLIVIEMPFGSFTQAQPAAKVEIIAHISDHSMVDGSGGDANDLDVQAANGFRYGTSSTGGVASETNLEVHTQTFRPEVVNFRKDYIGPEHETATGPSYPRSYEIYVDVATGQTINDLTVTDNLPSDIYYLGDAKVSVTNASGNVISGTTVTSPGSNGGIWADGDLKVGLGSVTGVAGYDAKITFDYYVPYVDANGAVIVARDSGDGKHADEVINDVVVSGNWDPLDGDDNDTTISMDNEVFANGTISTTPKNDEQFSAEAMAIQKDVAIKTDTLPVDLNGDGTPEQIYNPGDVVEYTLSFQISDYFSVGDIKITDILPDGLTLQSSTDGYAPTYAINAFGSNYTGNWDAGTSLTKTTLTGDSSKLVFDFTKASIGAGAHGILRGALTNTNDNDLDGETIPAATGTIKYYAKVEEQYVSEGTGNTNGDTFVDQGDIFKNDVKIDGTIYTYGGADSEARWDGDIASLQAGNTDTDDSSASFEIATGVVKKGVYAINKANPDPDGDGIFNMSPGDIVTYRLTYTLPTSDFESFSLEDFLPLPVLYATEFTAGETITASTDVVDNYGESPDSGNFALLNTDTFSTSSSIYPEIAVNTNANSILFNYGNYHTGTSTTNTIDIVFSVKVSDDPFVDGLYLTNQVRSIEDGTPGTELAQDEIVQIVLDQPELHITKGVIGTDNTNITPSDYVGNVGIVGTNNVTEVAEADFETSVDANLSGIDAGDTVTFAIVVQNSGHSDAFDVAISDNRPANFDIPAAGLNLSVTLGDRATPVAFTDANGHSYGNANFDFFSGIVLTDTSSGSLAANKDDNSSQTDNVVVITYDLTASVNVNPGQTLENTAAITRYAGAEGAGDHTTVDPSDTAKVTIDSPSVTKTVISTNQNHTTDNNVAVGELVTYQVEIQVQEGTTSNVTFKDELGAGLALVSNTTTTPQMTITASSGLTTSRGAWADVLNNPVVGNNGEDFTLDFGDIVNNNTNNGAKETITITYQAVATNVASNSKGVDLENHAKWNTGSTELTTGNALVNVVEPILNVSKTVSDSTPDSGDLVTFTIVVTNPNDTDSVDAFEVRLTDVVPSGYTYQDGTWALSSGPTPATLTDNANSDSTKGDLAATWATFAKGATATLTFKATVNNNLTAGQDLTNTVGIDWSSLPGDNTTPQSSYTGVSTERTGDINDPGGAANDHRASDEAEVIITGVIDKQAPASTNYTIGDTVTYDIVVTLPEATINELVVTDALPDGLVYKSHTIIPGNFNSSANLNNVVVDTSTGSGANDITFSFGNVIVTPDNDHTNDTFTIRVGVLVQNVNTNFDGVDLTNVASMTYKDPNPLATDPITITDQTGTPVNPAIKIVEPWIETDKVVVESSGVKAGDTVTYSVTLKNDGHATAYEVNFNDTLAQGTTFDKITSATIAGADVSSGTASVVNSDGSISFRNDSWDLAPNSDLVVTYTATVTTAGFTAGGYTNTVDADWSSRDGDVLGERVYDEDDGIDSPVDNGTHADRDKDVATFTVTTPGSLGNYVYFDSDGQGGDYNPAGGDVGISGVKVTISANLDGQGGPDYTQTVTTDENGGYSFTNLAIYDNYTITVDHSGTGGGFNLDGAGYTQTYDKDEGTVALDNVATSIAITAAAPVRTDINFGYKGSQSVGDLVWYDRNADGAQPNVDTGEAGLGGVKVQLKADIDGDSKIDYTAEVVTQSNGSYEFANLPGGSYTISAVPGAGYLATWDLDSTVTGGAADNSTAFTLPATGGSRDDVDFGLRGNASVSERVFFDVNNSGGDYQPGADLGIGKVDVRLSADFDGDGTPDYTLTTTTTDDGSYSFNNLLPGDYTITVDTTDLPVGMKQVYDAGEPNSGNFNNSHTLTLADGDAISTVNFGYTGSGSIEKYVWWDADASGTRDAGEVGLAGVELQLKGDFDGDNTIETIATTKTDADGKYIFDNLPSGSYTVKILSGIPASATETYDLDGVANGNKATNYSLGFNSLTGEVEKTELVNFGFNGKGVIGDTVWLDANDDGVFDAGTESGIAGVTVTLSADLDGQNGDKEFVVTTQTDANGKYSFDGLFTSAAGINYTVAVDNTTLPASATLTHDLDDKADGSVVTTTPGSAVVTLTDGAPEGLDTDFGYDIFSTIGDRVWLDNNGDGVQDAGEIGLAGITVKLFDGSGAQVETVVTDSSGKYVFTHLKAGDYRVETDNLPEGVRQTFDADGTLTANSATVTIGTGQTNLAVDFGYEATGSIGDRVWNNIDGDPTDNGGTEPGIPGVTVTLTGDFNNDGTVTPDETRSVVTDANGNYLFDNLIAGDYTVEVSDLPVGSVQNFDPDGTANSSTDVTLGGGQPLNTDAIDFGYRQAGAIGDRVWYDLNADGVQDVGENGLGRVTVKLFDGNDNLIAEVNTDSSGNYLFTDLTAGDYYVVVDNADLPGGMVQTHDRDDTNPAGLFTTPHRSDLITLGDKETVLDVDFGYTGSGSIGQVIWQDVNGNTMQDGGEPGVAGVTVTVRGDFNNDGDFNDPEDLMTTVTDANGNYSFTHLPQGPYTVTVDTSTLPPGMKPSTDSDGLATPHTVTGALTAGATTNNNFNFGYQQFSAIGDYVWYDIDGDGVKDPGELPIKGAQVSLTGDFDGDGDIDSVTITTDKNGFYLFDSNLITSNIAPGDYTVSVALPAALQGTEQTYDSDGLATPNSSNLTIAAGEVNLDQDFGFRGTGSIGDTVWYDLDEDGIVDPGEEGISGAKVTLEGDLDGDGVTDIVLETTTDANGKYSFDHLFAGDYTITSNPATATSNFSPVSDPDGTPDNRTTIKLGGGEKNSNINFGYKPINVPTETPAPAPESPTTTASPTTTKSQASPIPVRPYDSLFSSYVEDGENRDVQRWIDERPEEPVYQKPLLPVNPIYTGHAEPGTTLVINLTDAQGNSVGSQLVMADTGGNWLANFGGSLMYDMPHNIEIHQNSSLYNSSSAGGFNLRTYFMPALSNSPFTLSEQTMESIFATRPFAILQTLGEHYNQSAGLGWNDFYDYEYKAVSTNPSQSTL